MSSYPEYKFILTNTDEGTLTLTHAPIGWEKKSITFSRSQTYHGVNRSFSLSLQFIFEARDYIKNIYETYGINAVIDIEVQELDKTDFTYSTYYTGELDLSQYTETRDYIEVPIVDTRVMEKFNTRDDITLDLSSQRSLDYDYISGYSNYRHDLTVQKIDLAKTAVWDGNTRWTFSQDVSRFSYSFVYRGITTDDWDINEIGDDATLPPENTSSSDDRKIYVNNSGGTLSVGYKVIQEYEFQYTISGLGSSDEWRVEIDAYLPTGIEGTYDSGLQTGNGTYTGTISIDEDLLTTVSDGLSQSIFSAIKITNNNGIRTLTCTFDDFDILDQHIEWYIKYDGEADSVNPVYFPHEAVERALRLMCGTAVGLNSQILGRTDSEDTSYDYDGKGGLIAITSGLGLRGVLNRLFAPKVSFQDLFKGLSSVLNLGLWYDKSNEEFIIDHVGRFYQQEKIIEIDNVTELKIENYDEAYFNEIKAGAQDKVSYEDDAVSSVFSVPMTFSNQCIIKNIMDVSSPLRMDDYGINKAKGNNYIGSGEDTEYDEDIWLIDSRRDGSDYESKKYGFGLISIDADIDNINNGTTRINLDISGKRNMLRNGNKLSVPGHIDGGHLYFVSSQMKYNMGLRLYGEEEMMYELNSINYGDMPQPLFHPVVYTFNAPVTASQISTLMNDPHGYVQFTYDGETYKGYVLEVSTEPFMREGNWSLIKVNEDRNNLLKDLVGCWDLNEHRWTVTYDMHRGNNGTNDGATIKQAGKVGYAYDFDGSNDYISIPPDDFKFNPLTESYTISVWVKSADPSPSTYIPYIAGVWSATSGEVYPFTIIIEPSESDRVRMNLYNGYINLKVYIDGADVWDNTWHLVSMVVDHSEGEFYSYLDGVLQDTTSISYGSFSYNSSTYYFHIGTNPNSSPDRWYDGMMDQITIHNRALSATELLQLTEGINYNKFDR